MTHGDLRFQVAWQIYRKLKEKTLPEGLRELHAAVENMLMGRVPGNSWVAFVAFAEALPDYAEEIKDLCQ